MQWSWRGVADFTENDSAARCHVRDVSWVHLGRMSFLHKLFREKYSKVYYACRSCKVLENWSEFCSLSTVLSECCFPEGPRKLCCTTSLQNHIYPVRLHLQENSMHYLNVSANLYTWEITLLRSIKDIKLSLHNDVCWQVEKVNCEDVDRQSRKCRRWLPFQHHRSR